MKNQKGVAPILIILILAVGGLFVPLPSYNQAYCLEMYPPVCHEAGWKFGPSIWDQITGKPNQTVSQSLVQSSPNPAKSKITNGSIYDCGDIPDAAYPPYGHYDMRTGPEWSSDCKYVAWAMWESGTSCPDCPAAKLDGREGVFLYNNSSKKVVKIYDPQELGQTPVFVGWIDNMNFLYKISQKEFKYNLTTKEISPF